MRYVVDIECDALVATKIHCLSYRTEDNTDKKVLYDYKEMISFLSTATEIIGHNIIEYDIPTLKRILNVPIHARLIDTLLLSWTLNPMRKVHGLESYGEEYGVLKPKIDDWQNLSKEEYGIRCSTDTKINLILWLNQKKYLEALYKDDLPKMDNYIDYLSFKMSCVREQRDIGLNFDRNLCVTTLEQLEKEKEERKEALISVMPKVANKKIKTCPKVLYKANGELSKAGEEWFKLLKDKDLPPHTPEVTVITDYEDGNPNSVDQVKNWLYSLGWIPEHIKHVRDKKKNTVKKIPQVASKEGGGEICPSIHKLMDKEPNLIHLEGLSILTHRIGLLNGFLRDQVDGRLQASCAGLTNTLRLQHSVIVNLPSVERKYGKELRGCLIADEGSILCGSDLSGIEDSTKRHYIYDYDPEYVEEMNVEGYDPHLELGNLANMISQDEIKFFKWFANKS
jgi:hypothetical protein